VSACLEPEHRGIDGATGFTHTNQFAHLPAGFTFVFLPALVHHVTVAAIAGVRTHVYGLCIDSHRNLGAIRALAGIRQATADQ
jgi:hypothetical protein